MRATEHRTPQLFALYGTVLEHHRVVHARKNEITELAVPPIERPDMPSNANVDQRERNELSHGMPLSTDV
jgi:hypothetical protein